MGQLEARGLYRSVRSGTVSPESIQNASLFPHFLMLQPYWKKHWIHFFPLRILGKIPHNDNMTEDLLDVYVCMYVCNPLCICKEQLASHYRLIEHQHHIVTCTEGPQPTHIYVSTLWYADLWDLICLCHIYANIWRSRYCYSSLYGAQSTVVNRQTELVPSYKYLGTIIDKKLKFYLNTGMLYKKGWQHLHCLRKQKKGDIK